MRPGLLRLGGEKARAVMAALMLSRGRTVSTDALIDAVWERPPATAAHAVAVYVSRLRAAIEGIDAGRRPIVTRNTGYSLEIDADELDLERYRSLAARGRAAASASDWATAWQALGDALDVWRQPTPLACLTTSPLTEARIELEDERLSGIEDRMEAGLQLGLQADVLADLRTLTREHPERERLWVALMLALFRSGRQADALEAFLEARARLDEGFGIEPGPALRELQRRILEQDASLDLSSTHTESVSLPALPSSFVGREQDLDDAAGVLSQPDVRLLTVIGPGGIGKTRFAIELAQSLADDFPDGVSWIGFDAVEDGSRVLGEIASSLLGAPAGEPLEALVRTLQREADAARARLLRARARRRHGRPPPAPAGSEVARARHEP